MLLRLTAEQRRKYNAAIDTLIDLATTGEQIMTIHQLRHEFGEDFYIDNNGRKLTFTDYILEMRRANRNLWFGKYLNMHDNTG